MAKEERKINLHGKVKEKAEYKDYRTNTWQYRLLILFTGIVFFAVIYWVNPRKYMDQAFNSYIEAFGSPGLMMIFSLLSYALFRQYKKRKQ